MLKITLAILLLATSGCASNTTFDAGEQIDEFNVQEAGCKSAGGVMVVKRTGSRIRRPVARDRMATAMCEQQP